MALNINQRLNGLHSLSYLGDNAVQPPDFVTKARPPTANDSKNFALGDIWLDITGYPGTVPTAEDVWMLVALIGNQATWVNFSGGSSIVTSVTAGENLNDSGTAAAPIINLDRIIRWPNTTADGLQGAIYLGATCAANECTGGTLFMHNFGTGNTFLGQGSGNLTMTGTLNTGIGYLALSSNTSSNNNTAIGEQALASLTASPQGANTAVGSGALQALTTGSLNTVIGEHGLYNALTSNNCIAIGYSSGFSYIAGESNNTVIGTAMLGVAGENSVIRIGCPTSPVASNILIGNAAYSSISGTSNVTVGGGSSLASGFSNTLIGASSGSTITSGTNNCALGRTALNGLITGTNNVSIGEQSSTNFTGAESDNIIIGTLNKGVIGDSNTTRIGLSTGTGSGQINATYIAGIFGKSVDIVSGANAVIDNTGKLGTTVSSKRFKENIIDMNDYSKSIMKLRPVLFNYINDETKTTCPGLIAEEVNDVMPLLVIRDTDDQILTVKYQDLVPMLLNELQKVQQNLLNSNLLISELVTRVEILESKK